MRALIATTVLSAALLAACGPSAPPPPPPTPVVPIPGSVSGSLALREPRELSDAAKAEVRVIDVAQPEIVLAQVTLDPVGKLPAAYQLPIDASKVDRKRTYALEATLIDGDRHFHQVLQHPVLTDQKGTSKADVLLEADPTPAEKLFEEYKKAAAQTGALKSISGKYSTDNYGTAWDAFLSNGKVRFVREITDSFDDNAVRTTYKIAYKDEKPWVIVRESGPATGAPTATVKVGWGDDGTLVLHEKADGADVSEADAKAMYSHAENALSVAQGNAPKLNTGAQTETPAKPAPGKKKH